MIAPGEHMKNRISGYQDDIVLRSRFEAPSERSDVSADSDAIASRVTESIVALAKRKPVAVVVAGVVAGVIVGWLTKRNT